MRNRKVFFSLLALTCGIVFAPPLSFSSLELIDPDESHLNQLAEQLVGPKVSLEETSSIGTDFESFEIVSIPDNTSDGQKPTQYFQAPSGSALTELKRHDEERQKEQERELRQKFFQVSQALSTLASGSTTTNLLTSSVNNFGQHVIDLWWKEKVGSLPDWAKRIELEWALREDTNFDFEALTVQPLHESADGKNIFFTQFSVSHFERIQQYRTTTNLGLGYRWLLAENTVLLGINTFYDREWDNSHHRIGGGFEARWNNFDFYANLYRALGGARKIEGDTFEEALDGQDIEVTSQIPYLPWMRVRGKGFWWQTTAASKDIAGWSASTEMDITRNFRYCPKVS